MKKLFLCSLIIVMPLSAFFNIDDLKKAAEQHKKEIAFGAGASIAGLWSAHKWGSQNTLLALGTGMVAYSFLWIQRYHQLNATQHRLEQAQLPNVNKETFMFAGWKKNDWPLAQDLKNNVQAVKKAFKDTVQCIWPKNKYGQPQELKQYDEHNEQRIKEGITFELKELEALLHEIGSLCKAPQAIAESFLRNTDSTLSDHEKVIDCISELKKKNKLHFDEFKETIKQNCTPHCNTSLIYVPGINPFKWWHCFNPGNWRLVPRSDRATHVYLEVLEAYVRVSALHDVMHTTLQPDKQHEKIKKHLNDLNAVVLDMNNHQGSITGQDSDLLNAQIDRFNKAQDITGNLASLRDGRIQNTLETINTSLNLISDMIHNKPPRNRLIMRSLNNILESIEQAREIIAG